MRAHVAEEKLERRSLKTLNAKMESEQTRLTPQHAHRHADGSQLLMQTPMFYVDLEVDNEARQANQYMPGELMVAYGEEKIRMCLWRRLNRLLPPKFIVWTDAIRAPPVLKEVQVPATLSRWLRYASSIVNS